MENRNIEARERARDKRDHSNRTDAKRFLPLCSLFIDGMKNFIFLTIRKKSKKQFD